MDEYIIYIILGVLMLIVGGVIAAFLYPGRLADRNKCINCPHSVICDKGSTDRICHLEDKNN